MNLSLLSRTNERTNEPTDLTGGTGTTMRASEHVYLFVLPRTLEFINKCRSGPRATKIRLEHLSWPVTRRSLSV